MRALGLGGGTGSGALVGPQVGGRPTAKQGCARRQSAASNFCSWTRADAPRGRFLQGPNPHRKRAFRVAPEATSRPPLHGAEGAVRGGTTRPSSAFDARPILPNAC